MAEVEISYKGSNIATMNASGTKTLLTEAKYLEDDVTITYARPSAPSGTKNISITANGQTTEDVTNYASAQITANVPNTYSAGDEGKVVSNGALVAQGSDTVTQNDTYDTTLISSLTVNVSGGGGASVADVLQGDFPSGAVSFKATKNIPGRGVSGRSAMTSLEIDLTDNYALNGRAIENNSNMTLLVLTFPTSGSNTSNSDYCITANSKLKTLICRGRVYNFGQSGVRANSLLEVVDIENIDGSPTLFGNNCFYGNNNFKTLIIRDTSNVAKISSTTFTGSGLVSSGVVYVPSALISSYQTASNWSSLYSGGKLTFSALENSVYASADWYKA